MGANKDIEFYWISGSPFAWRVQLALLLKGLKYESKLLQRSTKDHKKPEYLALNPRGKVPLLKDGDFVITESMAIVGYLDRQYPEPPLYGTTPKETGRILESISEFDSYIVPDGLKVALAVYFDRIKGNEADLHERMGRLLKELENLEQKTSIWMVGDNVSAADICCYPFVASLLRAAGKERAGEVGIDKILPFDQKYPSLAAWCGRIEALPGYEHTYPPHWRGS